MIALAKVKMSSGGRGSGKSWTHSFAVDTGDLAIDAPAMEAAANQLINTIFKPEYPSNVFFDTISFSDLPKRVAGEDPGAYHVVPLQQTGNIPQDNVSNDRTALETAMTVRMHVPGRRPSLFWLRGALYESEVTFSPSGGWSMVPASAANRGDRLAAINVATLTLKPGTVNMDTRDPASFRAATKFSLGAVRARQVTVRRKKKEANSENGVIELLKDALPGIAGAIAFVLSRGKVGVSPAGRTAIVTVASSIGSLISTAIDTLTAPEDPALPGG